MYRCTPRLCTHLSCIRSPSLISVHVSDCAFRICRPSLLHAPCMLPSPTDDRAFPAAAVSVEQSAFPAAAVSVWNSLPSLQLLCLSGTVCLPCSCCVSLEQSAFPSAAVSVWNSLPSLQLLCLSGTVCLPFSCCVCLEQSAFPSAAVSVWNSLPVSIWASQSLAVFHSRIK